MESTLSSRILAKDVSCLEIKTRAPSRALYLEYQTKFHQQTIFVGSATSSIAEPRELIGACSYGNICDSSS